MHFIAKNIMKSFGQFFQMQKRTALLICDILIKMSSNLDIKFQSTKLLLTKSIKTLYDYSKYI